MILVEDDHEVVRQGIRAILRARPDCEVCGEAVDGREAIRLTKQLQPDVVTTRTFGAQSTNLGQSPDMNIAA
jgi:DNA-binding NarL/FixJ family response regulator